MTNFTSAYTGAQIDANIGIVAGSNLSATHKITRSASLVIAANDSSAKAKAQADYVCDGTADEVQIQAAIDALTTGGKVLLLEGTYILAATINMAASVTLEGQGFGTIIKRGDSTTQLVCISIGAVIGAVVKNLKIDGNKDNNAYVAGDNSQLILINQAVRCFIDGVWGDSGTNAGLYYYGNATNYYGPTITNSIFRACGESGIVLDTWGEYCRIIGCVSNYNTKRGFSLHGTGNVTISGCTALANSMSAVIIDMSSGGNPGKVNLTGCQFNHNQSGIYLYKAFRVGIYNCNVISNTQSGITLAGSYMNTISGGSIFTNGLGVGSTYNEIELIDVGSTYSKYNIFSGIIFGQTGTDKAAYSINEKENSDYNIFVNNAGYAGQVGGINKIGANSISENNILV